MKAQRIAHHHQDRSNHVDRLHAAAAATGARTQLADLLKPFPEALAWSLKKRDWTPGILAKMIGQKGCNEARMLEWLAGKASPSGDEWRMLKALAPELRGTRGVPEEKNPAPITPEERAVAERRLEHEVKALQRDRENIRITGWSDDNVPRAWGAALWYVRVRDGITRGQLARRLECTEQTIENYQNGRTTPVIESVRKIHDMFEDLVRWQEEGRVDVMIGIDMTKRPGLLEAVKPIKRAATIVPIHGTESVPMPVQAEAEAEALVVPTSKPEPPEPPEPSSPVMVIKEPVFVPPPPAPSALPARPGESERLMRELFEAIRSERAAQARLKIARDALETAQLAVMQAEEDCRPLEIEVQQAREARKRLNEELEQIAGLMV
jgi:ribosome-binding protein aMBF1 (putative translation factor)